MDEPVVVKVRKKRRNKRKRRGRPWGPAKDIITWTPEMLRAMRYCRRQLKLPLKIVAGYLGISEETLVRKMSLLRIPRRLKEYAPREVRNQYLKYAPDYITKYRPTEEGQEK